MNRIFKIAILSTLLAFCAGSYALQIQTTPQIETQDSTRYLEGKLLSRSDNSIKTTVGSYSLDHQVIVEDQIGTRNKTYSKDEVKPNVQLTFKGGRLIKVVIYP